MKAVLIALKDVVCIVIGTVVLGWCSIEAKTEIFKIFKKETNDM